MGEVRIEGAYASAVIHTVDNEETAIDQHALAQVRMLCDTEACAGSTMRVMPDVHAGKAGPVGLTMTVGERVMPALVGNDIGCGVTSAQVSAKKRGDFAKLDKVVRAAVARPSSADEKVAGPGLTPGAYIRALRCSKHVQEARAAAATGTLGGGNHFVELGQDSRGDLFLTVHSGSRLLGQQVHGHYMREGRRALAAKGIEVPYEMTRLEGALRDDYIADVELVRGYATLNREAIIHRICKAMKWNRGDTFDVAHNYIDAEEGMLRKGAISAYLNELVLIPVNMRDGILIGFGKGNPEWNHSAPHGAGRILKRVDVRSQHTVSEFKRQMEGVWCSCIGSDTLDEAPFAYRSVEDIAAAIGDAVEVADVLKPLYAFKNGGGK